MNCPKCTGGSYLSDEELVKVLENTEPIKMIIKQTFVCRSCGERFMRVASQDIDAVKKQQEQHMPAPGMPTSEFAVRPAGYPYRTQAPATPETQEKLRFLDEL